jgi:hypothetical protein
MDNQKDTQNPPPEFTEEDPARMSGSTRLGAEEGNALPPPDFQQFTEKDFPLAGEVPIPHVSPITAHVLVIMDSN